MFFVSEKRIREIVKDEVSSRRIHDAHEEWLGRRKDMHREAEMNKRIFNLTIMDDDVPVRSVVGKILEHLGLKVSRIEPGITLKGKDEA